MTILSTSTGGEGFNTLKARSWPTKLT